MGGLKSLITCYVSNEDVDHYNHLNNAMFCNYFEKGRLDLALKNNVDPDSLTPKQLAFLVKKASYNYIHQVGGGEEVEISSFYQDSKGIRVITQQEMRLQGKIVAQCEVEYFFVDWKTQKPIRLGKALEINPMISIFEQCES